MPKSKLRKKVQQSHAHEEQLHAVETPYQESPAWLVPVMIANFLIGLFWIVIYYITSGSSTVLPIGAIRNWNMAIGFTFIAIGFSLATKWR